MIRRIVAMAVTLALGLSGRAAADVLSVGDAAPKLEVKEFIKGDQVTSFQTGKTYVVEFWATWCGPCIVSIPHLTELQKKYKDVVFIGVSVMEQDQGKVKPFVEKMGEKMDYRVALDLIPDDKKGNDGKMAANWMQAAKQGGIPTAFIVNTDTKIAWIGHPMEMDKPLAQVVAGKWDLKVAAVEYKKEQALKVKMQALQGKIRKALGSKDFKGLLTIVEEAVKEDASLEPMLAYPKYMALLQLGDADKTVEFGNRLIDEIYKNNAQALNAVAWGVVEKPAEKTDPRVLKMALRAALLADKLAEEKEGAIADTLAKAYFENGDTAKALETQERAVKLAKDTPLAQDKDMKDRLEQYKKAIKK